MFPTPGRPVRGSRAGLPIMALLDLLGRRWAMGILWSLCRDDPATFRELQTRCGDVSPTVLNTRLKALRHAELVERTEHGDRATELGGELYTVLEPLKDWSRVWAAQARRQGALRFTPAFSRAGRSGDTAPSTGRCSSPAP